MTSAMSLRFVRSRVFFRGEQRPKKGHRSNVMDGYRKQMRGVESAEAENAGGKRERELYPPPLLVVVQRGEMRQRGVRDREKREGKRNGHR